MNFHVYEAGSGADATVSQRLDQLETLVKQIAGVVNSIIEQSAALAEKVDQVSDLIPSGPQATNGTAPVQTIEGTVPEHPVSR